MSKEEIVNAIQNLNDDDDFVRLEAESTIAMYMPDEIEVLHEEVLNVDYPKNTRLTIVELLRDLKDPSSMEVFVKLLNDRNKWIRRQSSSALADYGEDAVEPLLTVIDDENWRARGGAIWALGKIARPDTLDVFIKAAKDEGVTEKELTDKFIKIYLDDVKALNCLDIDYRPRVTETMPEIIDFIQLLLDKGHAYQSGDDVYFRVNSVPGYGELSKQVVDDLDAGNRIDVDENKSLV